MAEKDITGMRHGKCVAVRREGTIPIGNQDRTLATWLIRCDCGNEKVVVKQDFAQGDHRSCGCDRGPAIRRAQKNDLLGGRFGRLQVVAEAPNSVTSGGFSLVAWVAQCDCGNVITPDAGHLTRKRHPVRSCGCAHQEGLDLYWGAYREATESPMGRGALMTLGGLRIEAINRTKLFERDGGICHLCLGSVDPGSSWHVDHIVPVVKGGPHCYANVAVSHPKCNQVKHDDIDSAQLWRLADALEAFGRAHGI